MADDPQWLMADGPFTIPSAFSPEPWTASGARLAYLQTSEASHGHGRAKRFRCRVDDLLHRHLRIADRLLIRQHAAGHLLVEGAELAFDDLVEHVRWFTRVLHLRAVDRLLMFEDVGGD